MIGRSDAANARSAAGYIVAAGLRTTDGFRGTGAFMGHCPWECGAWISRGLSLDPNRAKCEPTGPTSGISVPWASPPHRVDGVNRVATVTPAAARLSHDRRRIDAPVPHESFSALSIRAVLWPALVRGLRRVDDPDRWEFRLTVPAAGAGPPRTSWCIPRSGRARSAEGRDRTGIVTQTTRRPFLRGARAPRPRSRGARSFGSTALTRQRGDHRRRQE